MKKFFIFILICFIFNLKAIGGDYPKYSLNVPKEWKDNNKAQGSLIRQIFNPDKTVLLEIYFSPFTQEINLKNYAKNWLSFMQNNDTKYTKNFVSEEDITFEYKDTHALHQQYSGTNNGFRIGSHIYHMQYDGFIVTVIGVYPIDFPQYAKSLLTLIKSFKPGEKKPPQKKIINSKYFSTAMKAYNNNENEKAFVYFLKAYKEGDSRAKNYAEQLDHDLKLANTISILKIQAMIFYQEKQYSECAELLNSAAEKGDAEAQLELSNFYYEGIGVKKDNIKSKKLLKQSLDQNLPEAYFQLGARYMNGTGGESKDIDAATNSFIKAAELGSVNAQYYLGVFYEESGQPKKSFKYYNMASEQGYPEATIKVGEYKEKFEEERIKKLTKLLSEANSSFSGQKLAIVSSVLNSEIQGGTQEEKLKRANNEIREYYQKKAKEQREERKRNELSPTAKILLGGAALFLIGKAVRGGVGILFSDYDAEAIAEYQNKCEQENLKKRINELSKIDKEIVKNRDRGKGIVYELLDSNEDKIYREIDKQKKEDELLRKRAKITSGY